MRKQVALKTLMSRLESFLNKHRRKVFNLHYRSKTKIAQKGCFMIGTGVCQVGNLQYVDKKPGFVKHPFRNTAASVRPVEEQTRKGSKRVWDLKKRLYDYDVNVRKIAQGLLAKLGQL